MAIILQHWPVIPKAAEKMEKKPGAPEFLYSIFEFTLFPLDHVCGPDCYCWKNSVRVDEQPSLEIEEPYRHLQYIRPA